MTYQTKDIIYVLHWCHVQFGIDQRFIYLQRGWMTLSLDHVMRPKNRDARHYFIFYSSPIEFKLNLTRVSFHPSIILFSLCLVTFSFFFLSLSLSSRTFFLFFFFVLLITLSLLGLSCRFHFTNPLSHSVSSFAIVQSHLVPRRNFTGQFSLYFWHFFSSLFFLHFSTSL